MPRKIAKAKLKIEVQLQQLQVKHERLHSLQTNWAIDCWIDPQAPRWVWKASDGKSLLLQDLHWTVLSWLHSWWWVAHFPWKSQTQWVIWRKKGETRRGHDKDPIVKRGFQIKIEGNGYKNWLNQQELWKSYKFYKNYGSYPKFK